jgi:hypothetical protein
MYVPKNMFKFSAQRYLRGTTLLEPHQLSRRLLRNGSGP